MTLLPCAALILSAWSVSAAPVDEMGDPVTVKLPDFGAEVRAFGDPDLNPIRWWPHVVNAAWGEGRGGPERNGGWLDENWLLVDAIDRSADYTTHEYLTHRGIWYEVYGHNEYQETIHFHEDGAKTLLWDNGIAQDMHGKRVLSQHYNTSVDWWNERVGWDAYIVCANAPRWWAVINYDWLTSPLLGHSISQDNIGGPTIRIGSGSHGRYCDHCNARFLNHLRTTGRLPEFEAEYGHIQEYARRHLMDVVHQLPPHARFRFNEEEAALIARLCDPPVMSEYQKSLYIAHLHSFLRYYRDAKLVARRRGREFDVHGNQGGGFVGPNPYQIAIADFVDTVWFETSGTSAYDMFQHQWNNAWGSFRYVMGRAMTEGRKPFMSMTGFRKRTPDLVEHEMAECCAGSGVLFVNQVGFEKAPELQKLLTSYFRFRHEHRALYAETGKRRHAQVALFYSIPTMMYHNYTSAVAAAPTSAMSGMARALEEGHIPYDAVILRHPEIQADRVTLEQLRKYRLIILPALECLSDSQIELLTEYVTSGGTLGLIGSNGVRDENNLPRIEPPSNAWREAGRVVEILPGRNFLPNRTRQSEATRKLTAAALDDVREALDHQTLISGELPRLLWVKPWVHFEELVSVHFVNYDVDFDSGAAAPTAPIQLEVTLPDGLAPQRAAWLTPNSDVADLDLKITGGRATVEIPSVRVYGVLLLGLEGLDGEHSNRLAEQALAARAEMACGGSWGLLAAQAEAIEQRRRDGAAPDSGAARALLVAAQEAADAKYLERAEAAGSAANAIIALDFGVDKSIEPWSAVGVDSHYDAAVGFGWLAPADDTDPTPEELYYDHAEKYGGRYTTDRAAGRLLFWPYKKPPPAPLQTNIGCGAPHCFRVDVDRGAYAVRVVTTNPSWTNRNFLVSGMVSVNGCVQLLDAAHDKGAIESREFIIPARKGKLELTFGGPTGWAVAALTITPTADVGREARAPLGQWRVSPRHPNPQWYPITWISTPLESRLESPPTDTWTPVSAAESGTPVVDLGSNREAEIGDVVYAATTITAHAAGPRILRFGASSSAQLWLNGESLGYVPNEKGVRESEVTAPVSLRAGENTLIVKLQRFWERRWMFYAELAEAD
ncbi:MAG: hypothetical protein ACYTG0_23460 [Planctomycetota bacterium]|jgi:hypothetical protein